MSPRRRVCRHDQDYTAVAAADVNKDGFTDFFFGRAGARRVFAMSDGDGALRRRVQGPPGSAGATAAQFVDYDNDGLLDLLIADAAGSAAVPQCRRPLDRRDGAREARCSGW